MESDFRAPWWLPGGHLQTVYTAKVTQCPQVPYRRERWATPDGDFIDVDRVDGDAGKPFLLLFHGMEGSSRSPYAASIMAQIARLGWSGAVPHFRSCSGEMNHGPRLYHCADYHEADWIIRWLHEERPQAGLETDRSPFYAAGVSLGGNVLLHWLARSQHGSGLVDAAAAICPPLEVAAGGHALSRGISRLYGHVFLRTLKPKAIRKLTQHPGLFCPDRVRQCRSIYEFDSVVTAPLHGFSNVDEYWEAASTVRLLDDIKVPTLVLNTLNDPCVPATSIPRSGTGSVRMEMARSGGHLGFTSGRFFPGRVTWLPDRLMRWFDTGR